MTSSLHVIIAPSLLSGDFARLADEVHHIVDECGADWVHMDVMDGHFVTNLTIGAPVVASLRPHTKAFIDCHLMVSRPEQWVNDFAKAGADSFTFHIEATSAPAELAAAVRRAGMRVGVAVKPGTSIQPVLELLAQAAPVDMVLIMSVEPGFGGQAFMPEVCGKIAQLRALYPCMDIQVDGGVKVDNIDVVAAAGANVIVAGSAIFKAPDHASVIKQLRAGVHKHISSS